MKKFSSIISTVGNINLGGMETCLGQVYYLLHLNVLEKYALKILTYLINVLYFSENVHFKIYVILSKILLSKHQFLKFKTKGTIAS